MRQLSPAGQQVIDSLAARHGFSSDATIAMLTAVLNGNGRMAQFNHAEFCGSGQWMQGGMTMVSDMFNNQMKSRVDALCNELSSLVANEPTLQVSGSFQSQSQGDTIGGQVLPASQQSDCAAPPGPVGMFMPSAPGSSGNWWPDGLGRPESTGVQNNLRYAWFGNPRRLVIDLAGTVTLYDTLDHRISGFSQQQSGGTSVTFTSQHGLVDIKCLPVLAVNGMPPVATPLPGQQASMSSSCLTATGERKEDDIFALIEKLAELRKRDILTDEEFSAKKAELLSRI